MLISGALLGKLSCCSSSLVLVHLAGTALRVAVRTVAGFLVASFLEVMAVDLDGAFSAFADAAVAPAPR